MENDCHNHYTNPVSLHHFIESEHLLVENILQNEEMQTEDHIEMEDIDHFA